VLLNKIAICIALAIFTCLAGFTGCGTKDPLEPEQGVGVPPEVVSVFPADQAIGIPVNTPIRVTFSENIDYTTLGPQTFACDHEVTGTIIYSPNTATLTPSPFLEFGETYTVAVTTDIKDKDGESLVESVWWHFTTGHPWSAASAISIARSGLGVAAANGRVYAMGGFDGMSYRNEMEEYNPATNQWTLVAPMPTGRYSLAAATGGSLIYAAGGVPTGGMPTAMEEYNPATNTWRARTSMPTPRIRLAAAAYQGIVWVIGGSGDSQDVGKLVERFDIQNNTWSTAASMPTTRAGLAVVLLNGKIYAIGGVQSASTHLSTVEVFDPGANSWSSATPMLTPRSNLAAAVVAGKIYVFGGVNATGTLSTVEEYDPATNSWKTKTPMPAPRQEMSAAALDGKIYVIGGYYQQMKADVYVYNPALDP